MTFTMNLFWWILKSPIVNVFWSHNLPQIIFPSFNNNKFNIPVVYQRKIYFKIFYRLISIYSKDRSLERVMKDESCVCVCRDNDNGRWTVTMSLERATAAKINVLHEHCTMSSSGSAGRKITFRIERIRGKTKMFSFFFEHFAQIFYILYQTTTFWLRL